MTDVDTSAEAVERLAHHAHKLLMGTTLDPAVAATLRALAAERDELLAELRATHEKHKHAQEMWAMHASSDRTHRADRDRLAAENARMRAALGKLRAAITNENNINGGAIIDTIWVSTIETAVDHIDAALTGDTRHG